jgi:plasmid stability protein
MATLHVRKVPDDLYAELQALAESSNRSLSAEIIVLLKEALRQEQGRRDQLKLLANIRRRRYTYPKQKGVPDSVVLLREDRAR